MNRIRPVLLATAAFVGSGVMALPAHAQMPPKPDSLSSSPTSGLGAGTGFSSPTPSAANPVAPGPSQNYAPDNNDGSGSMVDPNTVRRAQRQSQGDYGSLDRGTGAPLGMTQDAWNNPRAHMSQGQIAPGVVRFRWSPDFIMEVRIRDFMLTTLMFPEWEHITEVFIGENYYMKARIARPNMVLLRSSQSGIDTSVTAVGASGNTYTFYVRSEGTNTRQISDLMVFVDAPPPSGGNSGWTSGADALSTGGNNGMGVGSTGSPLAPEVDGPAIDGTARPGGAPTSPTHTGSLNNPDMLVPRDRMTFNMRMYEAHPGDRSIAPDYVYTDGVFTYFNYGTRARSVDRPVVLRVVDGVENRVNTRTEGRFGEVLVAEAVGNFVLRNGAKVVCVKQIPDATAHQ